MTIPGTIGAGALSVRKRGKGRTVKKGYGLIRRLLSLLCVLMMTFSAAAEGAGDLDEEVRTIFKRRRTSGGMVAAAVNGEMVYHLCYGFSNKTQKEKVTEESYFKLASVSKMVTALAVMKLVEEGRLDLDADLGSILGDPPYHAANPKYPKIALTCRQLMTHTAGIKDGKGAFAKGKPLSEVLDPKKNRTGSGFFDTKPGEVYAYSNFGAGILGSVLEAVTGRRLTDAVRELLFDPMGIDAAYHPTLLQDPEKIVNTYKANGSSDITRSYRLREDIYRTEINVDEDYRESYGGVWMRGADLCRIGIMMCNLGTYEDRQILSEESLVEMMSSQAGKGSVKTDGPYGLNVERVTGLVEGKTVYGHQGMANGVLCSLYFDPETRFVFALVTNGCNVNAKQDRICLLSRELLSLMWDHFVQK